jgi:CheY-like chemotaxis protein
MERLGGRLELDPEPAALGGAGFRIVLPLSTIAAQARRTPPAATRAGPLRGVRVAIVDDDPAVRATTVRLFERAGSEAQGLDPAGWATIADGVDALVEFAPGVILLDLSLGPHSAIDLARALGESAPALLERTLYFTGDALPGPLNRPVVTKLLPWEELPERIREEIPL